MAVEKVRAILFEVETRCNLDCVYCYNAWKAVPEYPRGRLSTRQTIKAVKKIVRESGATQVALTGGEPLLREDLPDIVAALTVGGTHVSVLTNGLLLDREWAEDLVRTGVKLFQLTLLAMNEALHDEHCGKGAFKGILAAAEVLKSVGAPLAITVVVTRKTLGELPELMRYIRSLDQKHFLLNRYNPGGKKVRDGTFRELMLSAEETRTMLKHAQDGARRYKIMPVAAVPIPPCVVDRKPFPAVRFAGCSAATNDAYFTLDPLGNVRMCNHSPVILGNILDQPFMEIANSKDADDWREVRPDFCKPCPGWSRCKGGCRAVVQQQGKPLTTLDPYVDMNVDKSRF